MGITYILSMVMPNKMTRTTLGAWSKALSQGWSLTKTKAQKDTFTIIVPKKFFSTQKDYGGLYIYNDWIYYPTTSLDRDSEGNPKTAQMVLMRTKVDGTGTQIIAEFDNHSVPYKIVDNTLAYIKDNNIYKINLNDKKFKPSLVEESVTNVKFTKPSDKASMDNFAIYTKTDPDTSEKYIIALSIQGDFKKTIFSSEMMGLDDVTFSATILDMKYVEDKLMILYNVEDNQKNKPYSGVYAYTYGKEFDFVKDNFVRFTQNVTSQRALNTLPFIMWRTKWRLWERMKTAIQRLTFMTMTALIFKTPLYSTHR